MTTNNGSQMSRNSTSNKSKVKSKARKPLPKVVSLESNKVGEVGNNSAEVSSLQAAEQRKAAEDLLVDKVLNGGLRLQLKVLEKVVPSLKETTLENFTREMQAVLNECQLTGYNSSGQKQCTLGKLSKTKELLKAKIVEKLNRNKSLSKNLMQEKLDFFAKKCQAVSVLCGRLSDLLKVLTLFTEFCKNIYSHLKTIVERQQVTDEPFEVAASNIEQLIRYNTCLRMHHIEEYECAKRFHKFTKFYVNHFSDFFINHEFGYHLRKNVVKYLQELASWLELFIPLLIKLGTSVFNVNGGTSPDEWQGLYRAYQIEQEKMFSEFEFADSPCDNENFAFLLNSIVDAFVKDVGQELKVMW